MTTQQVLQLQAIGREWQRSLFRELFQLPHLMKVQVGQGQYNGESEDGGMDAQVWAAKNRPFLLS